MEVEDGNGKGGGETQMGLMMIIPVKKVGIGIFHNTGLVDESGRVAVHVPGIHAA